MTSRHMLIVDSIPEGEYVSLVSVLDDYWGMAWKRLPKTQRQAWQKTEANGKHWDEHDAGERRRAAEIYDIGHGPSGIFFQQIGFYELEKPARLAAISALEAASLLLIREGDLLTRLGVPCPDKDAPLLARQLLNADEMVRGKPEDELIRATYQPLGEWLRRAKNAGIEYLSLIHI